MLVASTPTLLYISATNSCITERKIKNLRLMSSKRYKSTHYQYHYFFEVVTNIYCILYFFLHKKDSLDVIIHYYSNTDIRDLLEYEKRQMVKF